MLTLVKMDSGLVEEVEGRSSGMERKGRKEEETKSPHLPRQHMKQLCAPIYLIGKLSFSSFGTTS